MIKFVYDETTTINRLSSDEPDVIYLGPGFFKLGATSQIAILNHAMAHRKAMKKANKPVPSSALEARL